MYTSYTGKIHKKHTFLYIYYIYIGCTPYIIHVHTRTIQCDGSTSQLMNEHSTFNIEQKKHAGDPADHKITVFLAWPLPKSLLL